MLWFFRHSRLRGSRPELLGQFSMQVLDSCELSKCSEYNDISNVARIGSDESNESSVMYVLRDLGPFPIYASGFLEDCRIVSVRLFRQSQFRKRLGGN